MSAETPRLPDWIKVAPGVGAIREGDRYRIEREDGRAFEYEADATWRPSDFLPDEDYFVWPRPEPAVGTVVGMVVPTEALEALRKAHYEGSVTSSPDWMTPAEWLDAVGDFLAAVDAIGGADQ